MSGDEPKPPRGALSALMAGNVAIGMGVIAPAALINDLSAAFAVGPAEIGRLVVYGAIVLFLAAPLMAALTHKVDRRLLLLACLAIYTLGHAASAFATSFEALLGVRLAMIGAAAVYTPQAASALSLFVGPARRAQAVTYVFLGWAVATALGLPLLTLVSAALDWRAAFGLIGAIAAGAALAVHLTAPRGLVAPPLTRAAWGRIAAHRPIHLVLAVTCLFLIGQFTLFPYVAAELKRRLDLAPELIALTLALYGVAGVIGSGVATRLGPRVGAARGVLWCMAASGLGLSIWALGPESLAHGVLAVFVWGLGFSACVSLQQARLIQAAPELASAAVALNTSVLYLGQALGAASGRTLLTAGRADLIGWAGAGFVLLAAGASILAMRAYRI